jgi:ABC-2 type transport system permease protein
MSTATPRTSTPALTAADLTGLFRAGRHSPEPPGLGAASLAFATRALLKLRHNPTEVADAVMLPVIFTVMFTYLFGGALAGSTGDYLQFLLPGTLVMTVLLMAGAGGMSLNTDKDRGALDRFRSLPVWQPAVVVGAVIGDMVRYVVACALVLVLGVLMGFRPEGSLAGIVLGVGLVLVMAFALSWLWAAVGLLAGSPQTVAMISFLIQFPLTFASNAFVDPATMPGWLRPVIEANPVSLLITAERGLMQGTASFPDVAWVLVAAAALTAVFGPLTMHIYRTT